VAVLAELQDGVDTFVHSLERLEEGAVPCFDVGDELIHLLTGWVVIEPGAAGGEGLVVSVEDVVQRGVDAVLKVACGVAVEGLLCLGEGDSHLHLSGGFSVLSLVITGTLLEYCQAFANWC